MQNKGWKIPLILLLLGAGAWLFYQKVYLPKSTYAFVTPKRGDLPLKVFGIGTVGAKNLYNVASNSGGRLQSVLKDEGDRVAQGEVIARLDPVDLPQLLEQAQALARKAALETEASLKEIGSLRAQRTLAQINYDRYARLQNQGYAAKAEYDKARTDLASLDAQIAASQARVAASKAQEISARKSVEALRQKIRRLEVRSPVSGLVVKKLARAGETLAPQQAILQVVRPEEVWIRANIDERISGTIRPEQNATITLRSRSDQPLAGRVVRIERESDPVTEERIVDVAFAHLPEPFYLNEQAEVLITTGRIRDALLVPVKLLQKGGVWIYRRGKAHFLHLEILGRDDRFAAVRGLDEGAKILVPDPHKKPLFEGASIRL
ncbi:efflux RND transporter periplasmic adaptor subunit [Nitratifractor sp.]